MRQKLNTPLRRYLGRCALIACCALLFLLLDSFDLFDGWLICPLHFLGAYCPLCGMTRAMHALVRLDFAGMLRCHLLSPFLVVAVGYYAIVGLLAAVRGEGDYFARARRWPMYVMLALLLVFFILRNVWLFAFSYDPLGDMIPPTLP